MLMIEMATGVLGLYSLFSTNVNVQSEGKPETIGNTQVKEAKLDLKDKKELVAYIKEYFEDTPLLVEIARCESTFRHETPEGDILRGVVNSKDVGLMQINEYYHLKTSKELGYDIHTLEGNMAYAKYLYEKEGARPWSSSSKCWTKSDTYKRIAER